MSPSSTMEMAGPTSPPISSNAAYPSADVVPGVNGMNRTPATSAPTVTSSPYVTAMNKMQQGDYGFPWSSGTSSSVNTTQCYPANQTPFNAYQTPYASGEYYPGQIDNMLNNAQNNYHHYYNMSLTSSVSQPAQRNLDPTPANAMTTNSGPADSTESYELLDQKYQLMV